MRDRHFGSFFVFSAIANALNLLHVEQQQKNPLKIFTHLLSSINFNDDADGC